MGGVEVASEIRKRAKTRISDANPRFLALLGLLEPGSATAGRAFTALVEALTGGLWPTGHLLLGRTTLRFEGDWTNQLAVGRRVAFALDLSTIIQVRAGGSFLRSRIITLSTRHGEVFINPIIGGDVNTDVFLAALQQAVLNAGGRI